MIFIAMQQFLKKASRGFTLIEILVVMGIIAILAAVVIIAINPARQFAQARMSQRQANIESILNAIGQNMADNKGILSCADQIGAPEASTTLGTASPQVDLTDCLSDYLPAGIPMDPTDGTPENTQYQVSYNDSNGRYMVCAKTTESVLGDPVLCVVR